MEVRNGPVALHFQGSGAPKTGIHGIDFAAILEGLPHLFVGREWHGWRAHHPASSKMLVTADDEVGQYHSMSSHDSTSTTPQGDITDKIYKTWSCVSAFFRSSQTHHEPGNKRDFEVSGKKTRKHATNVSSKFACPFHTRAEERACGSEQTGGSRVEWGAPVRASAARHAAARPSSVMGRGG